MNARGRAAPLLAPLLLSLSAQAPPPTPAAPDWQPATDRAVLAGALELGREDKLPLYACRARAGGGLQPGRYRADWDGCHIGFAGGELSAAPFEVLAPAWADAAAGAVPPASFVGGQRVALSAGEFALRPAFPCRAAYGGGIHPGALAAGDRGCAFGFGGRQVVEPRYQVLWQAPWLHWAPGIVHQIPAGAVPAGAENGETFFVCRAATRTGILPGKIKQSAPGCSVASDGKEVVTELFSVLVPRWLEGSGGSVPRAALPEGHEGDALLFLCRAQMRGTVQLGKISETLGACRIGMSGGEQPATAYEVLSTP